MVLNRALAEGNEIFIFNKIYEGNIENDAHVIKGIIKRQIYSPDLFVHASPNCSATYEVLGEDGKMYYGNYGRSFVGDSFFLTKKDYIEYLYNEIVNNITKIKEIEMINTKINNILESIQDDKNDTKTR